jgi:hypothetical protein
MENPFNKYGTGVPLPQNRRSEPVLEMATLRSFATIRFTNAYCSGMSDKPSEYVAASTRLGQHARIVQCPIRELVPPKIVKALVAGLTRMPTIRTDNRMREASERQRWAKIVDAATSAPGLVGFITVGAGGSRTLAQRLDVPPALLTRTLNRWQARTPPLVECFYGPRVKRHPPLGWVQVPLVTDLILWAAEVRVPTLQGRHGPTVSLVASTVENLATLGSTGSSVDSWRTLQELNADLEQQIQQRG